MNLVDNSSGRVDMLKDFRSLLFMKIMLVQVLVVIFLCVNYLMIFTFLKKVMFREDTRYILFAQMLFVDSTLMVLSDMLVVVNYYQSRLHMISCMILCTAISVLTTCTPLTLVAMCLERYVAICMPLRHADISTSRTRCCCLLVIWGISSISPLFIFIAHFSVISPESLFSYVLCTVEIMLGVEWHAKTRSAILQLLFLIMIFAIVFTYISIMKAARAVSSENKKSTNKSLRTIILHAFQLLLCIMQFLLPYMEMVFWKLDAVVLSNLRYSNFVVFIIAPRCLSPLIYGLRDEKFFFVLRHNALCGLTTFIQLNSVNVK